MLEVKRSIDPAMTRSLHNGGANVSSHRLRKLVVNVVKLLSPQIHKALNHLIDHFIARITLRMQISLNSPKPLY